MEVTDTSQVGSSETLLLGQERTIFKRSADDWEGQAVTIAIQADTDDDPFNAGFGYLQGTMRYGVGGTTLVVPFVIKRGLLLSVPATAVEIIVKYVSTVKGAPTPINVRAIVSYGVKVGLGSRPDATFDTEPVVMGIGATVVFQTPRFSHLFTLCAANPAVFYTAGGLDLAARAQATVRAGFQTLVLGQFHPPDQLYLPSDTDNVAVLNNSGIATTVIASFGLDI
jgi:hypothetical protein